MALDPTGGFPETREPYAEFAGSEAEQALQFAHDIDDTMRANYALNIVNIGRRIYPILYVESTFDGGRYTLLVDESSRYVRQNAGAIYDICKAIAHIPLGIFSIVSGYGQYSRNAQWLPALQAYRHQIGRVRESLGCLDIEKPEVRHGLDEILHASLDYVDRAIDDERFSLEGFSAYSRALSEAILVCQNAAAQDQVCAMTEVLKEWRALIGEERWDRMYVVCNAIWTLTQENAHELIIKAQMEPERRETHVIVTEAAPTLDEARTLVGRIVGDRIMAELVFDPNGALPFRENIYSLSTRRDLLSQAVEAALEGSAAGGVAPISLCPRLGT